MKFRRSTFCLSVLLICLLSALTVSAAEILSNASGIELQGLNLGDAVIIEKIKTSRCDFDTSISG